MYKLKIIIFSLSILLFAAPQSYAAGKNRHESTSETLVKTIFSEVEKALIEEYFGKSKARDHDEYYDRHGQYKSKHKYKKKHKGKGKSKKMPPGLAKRKSLPPGLAKHLEKHGTLPAGLEKRDLPDDLLRRLPKSRHGTKRIIIDNDIVLIEEGTKIILDILKDVL